MKYKNLLVSEDKHSMTLTIHRPDNNNALNNDLMVEINQALDAAEANPDCKVIILQGENGVFCMGMDFKEVAADKRPPSLEQEKMFATAYCKTLKRFTTIPRVIISFVDGKVLAGGVGLVAASDLVYATERSSFGLSEVIWGLLPANVMPFLIRRVGFQPAYRMTLTTNNVSAQDAKQINLVDELTADPDKSLRIAKMRLARLHEKTLLRMKAYFHEMWFMDESMEQLAVDTLAELKMDDMVQTNIRNYIEHGKFPCDK